MSLRMMKRSDAAKYARWSAAVAIAISLIVVAAYLRRHFEEKEAQRIAPPPVPANVEQQSSQFSYSKVVGNRTLFSIRASRATEYKDQNRSALQDVLITMFGHNADRHDTISAHQCSYLPATGHIECQGEVQIQLQNTDARISSAYKGMRMVTRDISFDPATEIVSTPNAITLQIPGGLGQANGVEYDTKNETVKFQNGVKLQFNKFGGRVATPLYLDGSSLLYRRNRQLIDLAGPVTARQGPARLSAGSIELQLDSQTLPARIVASRGVSITDPTAQGPGSVSAERIEASFGSRGVIEGIIADGAVRADQKSAHGERSFSAEHVQVAMSVRGGRTQPHELNASGKILAESQEGEVTRRLETTSLHVDLLSCKESRQVCIANAGTQSPGSLTSIQSNGKDVVNAGKFSAEFNPDGKLSKLIGWEGVETTHQTKDKLPQHTHAQNLTALFSKSSDWSSIEETGGVKFDQGDRSAAANQAKIAEATNEVVLDGNASISDHSSNTSAAHIEINQDSGELHAIGSVISTYLGAAGTHPVAIGSGTAHISADRLDVSNPSGSELYSGHARLWQNGATSDSDRIEISPVQKIIHAQGSVQAVIPEAPGAAQKSAAPVLWRISAPELEYSGATGELSLKGGVQVDSSAGSLSGQTIQLLIASDARNRQRVQRAIVAGNVKIQSNGHMGTADRGEYTAKDGKFVLSGGEPKLSDTLGNITTGRELTFFLANDTILVDSQKGSRTVTKHRVEK